MDMRRLLGLTAVLVTIVGWCPDAALGQTPDPDEASIKEEILARYRSFMGTTSRSGGSCTVKVRWLTTRGPRNVVRPFVLMTFRSM
jgi:hypothetical protein